MEVRCIVCDELVLSDVCDKVDVARTLESGEIEKKKAWRCFDCKDKKKKERRLANGMPDMLRPVH